MKSIPPMAAVMTPFPYWVDIDDPIEHARGMMIGHNVHHLAVKRGDELISVLAERDVARAEASGLPTRAVIADGAYVVGLREPLDRVLMQMAERRVEAALVVKDGKLAGIFTLTDACRTFAELLRTLFPEGGDDAA